MSSIQCPRIELQTGLGRLSGVLKDSNRCYRAGVFTVCVSVEDSKQGMEILYILIGYSV